MSDPFVAVAVPENVRNFAVHAAGVAVVTHEIGRWTRSGALDAADVVLVPDALVEAQVAAGWAPGIARVVPGLGSMDIDQIAAVSSVLRPKTPRVGVSTCARTWASAPDWGDTYLAHGLMRGLRRLGRPTTELVKQDWNVEAASECDIVIHLRGLARRPVDRTQINVLWIISHPERIDRDELDDYDIIASASEDHAGRLGNEFERPVHFLPQAADADTFRLGRSDSRFTTPVLSVGNARWPNRRGPRWLVRQDLDFDLYGRGWADTPESHFVRGEFIDNRDLPAAYRSADVVVADHHGSMRRDGFLANRLFDVLASGGLVVSDDVAGLGSTFGDVVPVYTDETSLHSLLTDLLGDAPRRQRLSDAGRKLVSDRHTLDHRAAAILEMVAARSPTPQRTPPYG